MAELELRFSWWRPRRGFKLVQGPEYAIEAYAEGAIEKPHGPPWLVSLPRPENDADKEPLLLKKELPGLHQEFADLSFEVEVILKFANRYGRLTRYGQVMLRKQAAALAELYAGESLHFWRHCIQEMRDAVLLWRLLGGPTGVPDEQGLRQLIVWEEDEVWFRPAGEKLWFLFKQRSHWSHRFGEAQRRGEKEEAEHARRQMEYSGKQILKYLAGTDRAFLGMKPIASADSGVEGFLQWREKRDVVQPARWLLCNMISQNLEGRVELVVEPAKVGGYRTVLEPQDLLAAMWLQLYFETTGRTRLSQCPVCGAWFDATHSPQRIYCDRRGSGCRQKAARLRKKLKELLTEGKTLEEAAGELKMDVVKANFLLSTAKTQAQD